MLYFRHSHTVKISNNAENYQSEIQITCYKLLWTLAVSKSQWQLSLTFDVSHTDLYANYRARI